MIEWDFESYCFKPTNLLTIEIVQGDMIHAGYEDFDYKHRYDTEIDIEKIIRKHFGDKTNQSPKAKAYNKTRAKEHYNNNLHKYQAKSKVRRALETGKLIKPDKCSYCKIPNVISRLHGHHESYEKPLEVIWLCPSCHYKLHKGIITL
jgi:hypothetical protein